MQPSELHNPFVSVVIPTLNRGHVLIDTLRYVLAQTYSHFEIIVVDQTSPISSKVTDFCKQNNIIYMHSNIKGQTFAKNLAAVNAKGDILVFFDDDIEIQTKDAIAYIVEDFQKDPQVGLIAGRIHQHNNLPVEQISKTDVGVFNPLTGRVESNWNYNKEMIVHNICGANSAVRKELIERVGGFNTLHAFNFYFEETEFALRAEKLGFTILFDPRVEIIHLQETGGSRIKNEKSHQEIEQDEYRYTMSYAYNFMVLLLCNYPWYYQLTFTLREIVKRLITYIVKGFKRNKLLHLKATLEGTLQAYKVALTHQSYITHRRKFISP